MGREGAERTGDRWPGTATAKASEAEASPDLGEERIARPPNGAEGASHGDEEPPTGLVAALLAGASRSLVPVLAIVSAFVVGALVIVVSDRQALPLWPTDPLTAFRLSLETVAAAYSALLRGALGDPGTYVAAFASGDPARIVAAFNPVSESLLSATPLIFTGLAVALGFRSGLFNIGAEGQLYIGAMFATYVGFAVTGLPFVLHLPLALAAGALGGAVWGFIPGLLKARTGAHEVITTIMLNYVSYRVIDWILKQPFYQREGRTDPISKIVESTAQLPPIVEGLRVHWGFLLALAAAVFVSWLLFRSTLGFEFRAVGLNPSAARYAGINVARTLVLTMGIGGALAGLAGTAEILGANKTLTAGFSPGYGFDAIALALLGGSRPAGVVAAALLFGALRAGATPMQSATGIPIDLVVVIQALVIMFVAAPALVRAIYRIRAPEKAALESFSKGWGA